MPMFEKQINLLDYTLSSVWRRKFKNISVVAVFSTVIFLLASFQFLTGSLATSAEQILSSVPEIVVQKMVAGRQESMPLAHGATLRSLFGIRSITPRIWGYYFDETNGANYTVIGLPDTALQNEAVSKMPLAEGKSMVAGEEGGTLVGHSVHASLDLKGRKRYSFFRPDLSNKPLAVTGVFSKEAEIVTADLVVMSLADARDLFLLPPDMVTDFSVTVANPAEITTIAKKIAARLPDTRVITRPQIQKTYTVVFGWRSGFAAVLLLTCLAAFTILAWDKASGLSPEERREIAILKVLGWETTDILAVRFWEGMVTSGIAFIVGCLLAYLHVLWFQGSLFKPLLVGWSVLRPQLTLVPTVRMEDVLLLLCFTVAPYLAATIIPAWRCAVVPPDAAIR